MDGFKTVIMGGTEFAVPEDSNPAHFQLMNREMFELKIYDYHKCPLPDAGTILDIGANIGAFAVYALRKDNTKVISVEPCHCLPSLRKNLLPFGSRSTVIGQGVWSHKTTLRFDINRFNPGCDKVIRPGDVQQELTDLSVTTIDCIVEDLNLKDITFIKMDIEGSEREAIEGARTTIKKFRPKMALSVYHRDRDEKIVPKLVKDMVGMYNFEIVAYPIVWKTGTRVEVINSNIAYFW